MDTTLVKFLILWMMCKNISLTTSMPPKETSDEDSHSRLKRTPADSFSLFGFNLGSSRSIPNPFTKVQESFSSIGNIFSLNHGNTHKYDQPIEPHSIVQDKNIIKPANIINKSGITNSITQDDYQNLNKSNGQYQAKNELDVSVTNKKQIMNNTANRKTEHNTSERKEEITENKPDNQESGKNEVDQQLLDYIFQTEPDFDGMTTTVDPLDFTTETGEYENTTNNELLRIPPQVVASLLG